MRCVGAATRNKKIVIVNVQVGHTFGSTLGLSAGGDAIVFTVFWTP
jgi:hypothetical protein